MFHICSREPAVRFKAPTGARLIGGRMAVAVERFSLPEAGIDDVDITIEETYEVEGLGRDTVTLRGTLVADRGAPLLGHDESELAWETSTVVARFTSLDVRGESEVFGPVRVLLDPSAPSFGVVKGGKCAANIAVIVAMPRHDLTLRSAGPMALRSTVETVPPIGDERTESVRPVALHDTKSGRQLGQLESARVMWRELTAQVEHPTLATRANGGSERSLSDRLDRLERRFDELLDRLRG